MSGSRVRELWSRWKFHLSALVLIGPITAAPGLIHDYANMHDARVLAPREIGPWTVTLAEHSPGPPHTTRAGRRMQDMSAVFCEECRSGIRGAFLHAGSRPAIDAPGWPLHGNRHHLEAHVEFPREPSPGDSLWLTAEGWDGSVHQIAWPLVDGALPVGPAGGVSAMYP